MAITEEAKRPIIIKKIKKGGHAHHGGAWKVAYADFVTAMMAFFLMLWLLSSVDKNKLEGLAEYFTPTVGIKDSMGIGFDGGATANKDGNKKHDESPPGIVVGIQQQGPIPDEQKEAMIESDKDAKLFEKAEEEMKRAFESDPNLRDLTENIVMEQTPEGLKIEIMDSDKHPMFQPGSPELSEFGRRILAKMAKVIEVMPNYISLTGHTDVSPMTSRGGAYSNWELSADRANAARRFLLQAGMDPERPKKVTGMASADLLLPEEPLSARNRRITIIMLRGDYLELDPSMMPATRDLLSVPQPNEMRKQAESEKRREARKKAEAEAKRKEQESLLKPKPESMPLSPGQSPLPIDSAPRPAEPEKPAAGTIGVAPTVPEPIRERTPEDFAPFTE